MEEEQKQTSIVLPWCLLGTGTMGRNEQQNVQKKKDIENVSGHRRIEVSKMPADRGWLRCRWMKGSIEGC